MTRRWLGVERSLVVGSSCRVSRPTQRTSEANKIHKAA
jgi:hypothetical protein